MDTSGQQPLERSIISGHRWWTAEEVRASEEPVFPVGLGDLVEQLLRGVPARPARPPWRI